ncbi:MAG: hypothetical protein CVU43_05780 [Chloroflexi bacterium HGW-Chloroflexi-5]|jgi:phage FluMu protein Com|nr:MAG: hypothetical protein CVU43_05780 [Chloroflexi bacterium HGW-Chloroflexi-5]
MPEINKALLKRMIPKSNDLDEILEQFEGVSREEAIAELHKIYRDEPKFRNIIDKAIEKSSLPGIIRNSLKICLFCRHDDLLDFKDGGFNTTILYDCPRCKQINITTEAEKEEFRTHTDDQKVLMSIILRNQWQYGIRKYGDMITMGTISALVEEISKLNLNYAYQKERILANISHIEKVRGEELEIDPDTDYTFYYCRSADEFRDIFRTIYEETYILSSKPKLPWKKFSINPSKREEIERIPKYGKSS